MTRGRILLVDDDSIVRQMTSAVLEDDFDVTTARDAQEALKRIEGATFDVVVTDLMMPGLTGLQLLRKIALLHPGIVGVLMTGSHINVAERGILVLLKPVNPDELLLAVRSAVVLARSSRKG